MPPLAQKPWLLNACRFKFKLQSQEIKSFTLQCLRVCFLFFSLPQLLSLPAFTEAVPQFGTETPFSLFPTHLSFSKSFIYFFSLNSTTAFSTKL